MLSNSRSSTGSRRNRLRQIAASSLPARPSSRGLHLRWIRRASGGRHGQDLARVKQISQNSFYETDDDDEEDDDDDDDDGDNDNTNN